MSFRFFIPILMIFIFIAPNVTFEILKMNECKIEYSDG